MSPPGDRRAEIIETALTLAFEAGPSRVTTVAIADRLGLTQPAIYRHFRSKAAMWEAINDRLGREMSDNIATVETSDAPVTERLRSLVLGQLALIRKNPALPEIMVARDPDSADAVVRATMQAQMARFHATLIALCREAQAKGTLKQGLTPQDAALLLMGILQSLALRLILSRDVSTILEDGARLLSLQLSAFFPESDP